MTAPPVPEWRLLLSALADTLPEEVLADPGWRRAFLTVPRHVFVPGFYTDERPRPRWVSLDDPSWLPRVYSDTSLVTQIRRHPDDPHNWWPTSSSSRPSLMLAMLHALDVADGMRVLELGTGTGYNAALLAARLGADRVVSVEVDPVLAAQARRRLEAAELTPTLVVGDGEHGVPEHAPYDRVLATAAAADVPYAWVAQTRPGGLVVLPWGTPYSSTGLLRLRVGADGTASGRVVRRAGFMWLRRQRAPAGGWRCYVDPEAEADVSSTTVDPADLVPFDSPARFAVGVLVPGLCQVVLPAADGSGRATLWLYDGGGAWASVDHVPGAYASVVAQHGRRRLWDEVERAHRWWERAGRPHRERFGVTVAPDGQTVWLDAPDRPVPAPLAG